MHSNTINRTKTCSPMRSAALASALAGMLAAVTLGGCSNSNRASAPSSSSQSGSTPDAGRASLGRAAYFVAFEEGRYREAYSEASSAAGRYGPGLAKEQAMLIAGLSAQALNRGTEAEQQLEPLLSSTDPMISGRANAGMGLIAQGRGRHNEAINYLLAAGDALTGDDAARSLLYAGDSYRAMGQLGAATDVYAKAQTKVESDSNLRAQLAQRVRGGYIPQGGVGGNGTAIVSVPERRSSGIAGGSSSGVIGRQTPTGNGVPTGGSYTVQLGAFSSLTTARQEAAKIGGIPPRIVSTVDRNGRTLYAVRVGVFGNQQMAEQVRAKMGGRGVVMRSE